MNFNRNNLDRSNSPYLLQHKDNPVWWQEWNSAVLQHASETKKPLFVSAGYSTCHWCHVMAGEAFSDKETADLLNSGFISIKIDREERPDIDQFMMDIINRQTGSGGWPLNVFLMPDLRPVYALTYAPPVNRGSMLSFLEIARRVSAFIAQKGDSLPEYKPETYYPSVVQENTLMDTINRNFDRENGGFGYGHKFPSHSTMLFLLYLIAADDNPAASEICIKTLDAMMLGGLNDHLQGGIFRYCVDRSWTIPHFEKMLYDQAMGLWVYSLAFRITCNAAYKTMSEKIILCLEESFRQGEFYITAHDADTDHSEGGTYLWSHDELKQILSREELSVFTATYVISTEGNFEGMNHLIRRNGNDISQIESKLLAIRKTRKQPSCDGKILCGLNALTAIAFIQAGRLLNRVDIEEKGTILVKNLLDIFWNGEVLGHSYYRGVRLSQSYLSDAAALLTAVTMLYESDPGWNEPMTSLARYVNSFREGKGWVESRASDFIPVEAALYDHPVPSGISLLWMGMTRAVILSGGEASAIDYRQALQADFYNIATLISNGSFHVYTSKDHIPWSKLPANSIQRRGTPENDCFRGSCRPLNQNSPED